MDAPNVMRGIGSSFINEMRNDSADFPSLLCQNINDSQNELLRIVFNSFCHFEVLYEPLFCN